MQHWKRSSSNPGMISRAYAEYDVNWNGSRSHEPFMLSDTSQKSIYLRNLSVLQEEGGGCTSCSLCGPSSICNTVSFWSLLLFTQLHVSCRQPIAVWSLVLRMQTIWKQTGYLKSFWFLFVALEISQTSDIDKSLNYSRSVYRGLEEPDSTHEQPCAESFAPACRSVC